MKKNIQKDCSKKNSLRKNERLRGKNNIEALFAPRKAIRATSDFTLFFRKNEGGEEHQIMFIVPKRNVRKAHKRVRIRRIMRAIYRTRKQHFFPENGQLWMLGLRFNGSEIESFENAEKQIEKTFKKFNNEVSQIDK